MRTIGQTSTKSVLKSSKFMFILLIITANEKIISKILILNHMISRIEY